MTQSFIAVCDANNVHPFDARNGIMDLYPRVQMPRVAVKASLDRELSKKEHAEFYAWLEQQVPQMADQVRR